MSIAPPADLPPILFRIHRRAPGAHRGNVMLHPAWFVSVIFVISVVKLAPILFFAHLFHPIDHLAVQRFLNSDMRHRGCWRGAVPMLLTRRKPNDIARPDFLDWFAPTLRPSEAGRDDQCLTEWMCMPGGAST